MPLLAARPALKDIVSEAARALARLDADRLEELALSCQALNRDLMREAAREASGDFDADIPPVEILPFKAADRARLAAEAREARRDMALFARVLDATRANVHVIERLRDLRSGRIEYAAWHPVRLGPAPIETSPSESRHGND